MKAHANAAEEPRPAPTGKSEETSTRHSGMLATSKPRLKKEKREPSDERGPETSIELKERKGSPSEMETYILGETANAMADLP